MPELPEVETIRRGLAPRLEGRRILAVQTHPSAKFAGARPAAGHTVQHVGRRGKYLLVDLDGGSQLAIHLGMTGMLCLRGETDEDEAYTRASFSLDDGTVLDYRDVRRFGRLAVVPAHDHSALPTLHALGPEPFDAAFTPEHLWRAVRSSRRAVKTQLLSQRPVAGVGNIYADEALWRARVHPANTSLTATEAAALHATIVAVLRQGIDRHGTTLRDYRTFDGDYGNNQDHLDCYGRSGAPCRRCGTELRRVVIDARSTTFCPTCQVRHRGQARKRPLTPTTRGMPSAASRGRAGRSR